MAKKRGSGEGSIYQRSDARWVAAITVIQPGQERRQICSYHATQAEAIEGLDKLKTDRKHGALPTPKAKRTTVADHLDMWLEHSVRASVRPLTYESYRQHVRVHLKPALGGIRLEKLTAPHIRTFITEKLQSGLSARTVKYSLVILRLALKQAVEDQIVPRNVAAGLKGPAYERPMVATLDAHQAQQLIRAVEGERLGAAYLVGLSVGLRRGEVLGLRWDAIDFLQRKLRVSQALERIGGKLQFVAPKSKKSIRTISLPDELVAALRQHRGQQLEERLQRGSEWTDSGLCFTTHIGTPIEPRNLTRDFKRVVRKAGLSEKLRLHDLRHSCASLLLAQKVPARVVMEVLGHSQISLTMDTYSHVMPDAMREAADSMSVALAVGK
jgi:integrase